MLNSTAPAIAAIGSTIKLTLSATTVVACLAFMSCNRQESPTSLEDTAHQGPVTLGVVTGLGGVTEPCGCTSTPLGGLDRLAGLVQQQTKAGPFALLLAGDTFVEHADPPGHLYEQEQEKARAIAAVLGRLKPLALARGDKDLQVHRPFLERLANSHQLPAFAQPRTPTTRERADFVLKTVGGLKIGVVGMPAGHVDPAAYSVRGQYMQTEGADLVVALVPLGGEAGRRFAATLAGVDVVVLGGGDASPGPVDTTARGGKIVVEAGDKGRYLGLLRLHPNPAQSLRPWSFDDQGQARRQSITARMERLQADIQRLENGPAKAARMAKLAELEQELTGAESEPPKGAYITFEAVPVTASIAAAPWATELMQGYNRALCSITKDATAERACPQPSPGSHGFVGTQVCQGCHASAHEVYAKTRHAKAWATLQNVAKDCDWTCIGCHSVGFEKPGGFCRLQDAEPFANVGCESCHGPGAGHAESPGASDAFGSHFMRSPNAAVCEGCHNKEHSDHFDFDTYVPKILGPGHGKPL